MSSPTVSSIRAVGTSSSTSVSTVAWMGCVSLPEQPQQHPQRGQRAQLHAPEDAGPALHPEEVEEVHPRKAAQQDAGGVPHQRGCALQIGGHRNGDEHRHRRDASACRAMASPTGATISTVATLSTKALMTPATGPAPHTAHRTSGTWTMSCSASRAGILLWMKRDTVPIVPAIISSTLKSTARAASASVKSYTPSFPSSRNVPAPPSATQGRYCCSRQHQNIRQRRTGSSASVISSPPQVPAAWRPRRSSGSPRPAR